MRRPWVVWSVFLAVAVTGAVLKALYAEDDGASFPISVLAAFAVFATVGALILARRPKHAIGRIYLAGALAGGVGTLASGLIDLDHTLGGAMPGRTLAYIVGKIFGDLPLVILLPFPVLLFPDGKLRSRLWRVPFIAAVVGVTAVAARGAFVPGHFDQGPAAPVNPLGMRGAKSIIEAASTSGTIVVGLVALAGVVSLFVRFRRSSGVEREQYKWLGWAGAWTAVLLFTAGPGTYGQIIPRPIGPLLLPLAPYIFALAIAVIPLFTAVAILRYRLYDIDRIVSRTIAYAVITAVLLGAYAGLVVVLQQASEAVVGGSDLAVAVSTLVVAAAFVPLRRRVQTLVDRRFNRARYDAQQTIEGFSARLREETDIDRLTDELKGVVHQTMQPTNVSLWVRTP